MKSAQQLTNTLVVDPHQSSNVQCGITSCCGHHIKISPLLPPLNTWSSPGNGSVSHRVAIVSCVTLLCHLPRCPITSPLSLHISVQCSLVIVALSMEFY
ncbi:hypothetical protein E2C01_029117 [Portunus trituberculatus]|uniref:Uncharacterized protein n=1 Tax=Portunus trituberculatus TaxID=210409 RepID=A0A5B7EQY5_PORTR|nr:hypothetical protein [Portunus trituberculatus]